MLKLMRLICGIVLLATFVGCRNKSEPAPATVIKGPSLAYFTNDFAIEIHNASNFVVKFIEEYRSVIRKHAHSNFYESVPLMTTGYRADVILSEVTEGFVKISPSSSNVISVSCGRYPAQLSLLVGADLNSGGGNLNLRNKTNANDVIPISPTDAYPDIPGSVVVTAKQSFIDSLSFESTRPRVFELSPDVMVALRNVEVRFRTHFVSNIFNFDGINVLLANRDFTYQIAAGSRGVGQFFAEAELQQLFLKSDLFKKSLAHPSLKPIADEILARRKEESEGREYPHWEFETHKEKLIRAAQAFNLPEAYAAEYLEHAKNQPVGGTLVFAYKTNGEFLWQWFYISCACLACLLALLIPSKKGRLLIMGILFGATLAIQAYVLAQKPTGLSLIRCFFPFLPCLIFWLCYSRILYKNHLGGRPKAEPTK